MQARQGYQAESSSSSYGLVVHLLLLPTPPLGDAVAFGFRPESVYLERTCTSLIVRALRRTCHGLGPWRFTLAAHCVTLQRTARNVRLHRAGRWHLNSSLARFFSFPSA